MLRLQAGAAAAARLAQTDSIDLQPIKESARPLRFPKQSILVELEPTWHARSIAVWCTHTPA
jgi:hypothetical protein